MNLKKVRQHRAGCVLGTAGAILIPTALPAQPGTGGGDTESALIITGVTTLLIVMLTFLVLIIPEEDRKVLAAAINRMRRYLLTGAHERAVVMDHNFDGIQELDNRIPPWFTTLFSVTVIFASVYMLNFHVFHSSKLSQEEYAEELAVADLQRRVALASGGSIDESVLVALKDSMSIQIGHDLFTKNCVSCHGLLGGGGVGPNLTDDYWIHGGGIRNVYASVKNGWPEKGMISWKLVFTPRQIQQIASFVLLLHGTNPPGGKSPQGDFYVEMDTTATVVEAPMPAAKGSQK